MYTPLLPWNIVRENFIMFDLSFCKRPFRGVCSSVKLFFPSILAICDLISILFLLSYEHNFMRICFPRFLDDGVPWATSPFLSNARARTSKFDSPLRRTYSLAGEEFIAYTLMKRLEAYLPVAESFGFVADLRYLSTGMNGSVMFLPASCKLAARMSAMNSAGTVLAKKKRK